jgi:hypothetical protein
MKQKETNKMKKPNLQQYFKECQERGIFDHEVRATDDVNKGIFYIHPKGADGETLDFYVRGNELEQLCVSQEDDIRNTLGQIIGGLPLERLKEVANQFGLNYK